MGCFSWKDCVTGEQIKCDRWRDVYLLIPKEFGGGRILEPRYNGYGKFGGKDVYELVAEWNRNYLEDFVFDEYPQLERYGGFYDFEIKAMREQGMSEEEIAHKKLLKAARYHSMAVKRYYRDRMRIEYFRKGLSEEELEELFGSREEVGNTQLRLIGIDIACGDEKNSRLRYPIKLTHSIFTNYEDCPYSPEDPNQGCD